MQTTRRLFVRDASRVVALLGSAGYPDPHQKLAWQADVQIKTLEVTKARSGISVRVVVDTEHDDEARDTRLVILLPLGAGPQKMVAGCTASPAPSIMPSLLATVTCELGSLADRGFHEVLAQLCRHQTGASLAWGLSPTALQPTGGPATTARSEFSPDASKFSTSEEES